MTKIRTIKNESIEKCLFLIVYFSILSGINLFAQQRVEGISYIDGKPIAIEIQDGLITRVEYIGKLSDEKQKHYLAPGLIDNQVNGFNGVAFSYGLGDLTIQGIKKATYGLWQNGVTTYLPTLITNSQEVLKSNLSILKNAKDDESLLGSIAGFHLEGPYISPVDGYRGAHSAKYIRNPLWNEFMELYEASGENIVTITVAPEMEGAIDFITKCSESGIIVALGHHNGSVWKINEAVEKGAKICTHLGNGCANQINRHDNPIWPQLANDNLIISIICDGFHLRPEEIRTFFKVKGVDKTILTSDVTKYAGMTPGIYKNIQGDNLELTAEGKVQYPAQKVLAGAGLAINRGVVHIMEVINCSLSDAIQMASTNPAKLYGFDDRGSLEVGKRADLILFDIGPRELKIYKTYVKGQLVYDSGN